MTDGLFISLMTKFVDVDYRKALVNYYKSRLFSSKYSLLMSINPSLSKSKQPSIALCCNPLLDCFLCDSRSLLLAVFCLFWPYMGP